MLIASYKMLTRRCHLLIASYKMLTSSGDEIRLARQDWRLRGRARVRRWWREVDVVQLVVVSRLVVDHDVLVDILIHRQMVLLVSRQSCGELSPGELGQLNRAGELLLQKFRVDFLQLGEAGTGGDRDGEELSIGGDHPGIDRQILAQLAEGRARPLSQHLRVDSALLSSQLGELRELGHRPGLGHLRGRPLDQDLGVNLVQSPSRGGSLHPQVRIYFF